MHYVIVGNSVAGVNCVEAIRSVHREGTITVVSDEDMVNYSRPLLSGFLGGKLTEDKLFFRDSDFYEKNRVNLLLSKRAERLSVSEQTVTLEDGTVLPYDRLLISVGGLPIMPPIEGLEDEVKGVFTFLKWKEARAVVGYIERKEIKEAVVLGAGLIGLKVIEGLLERGLRVTVVELTDRILANTFDDEASSILEKQLAQHGCRVVKEDTIERIRTRGGRIRRAILGNGEEITTALLIIAAGVRPNLMLVEGTSIKTDRGILVDRFMMTNIRDIYAAGDCAQGLNLLSGDDAVIAIWPVAARQGRVAGLNMAGVQTQYSGLFPMNAVHILDIPTISFGTTNPVDGEGYEVLKRLDRERGFYKKIILKDGKVVGGILLNCVERAGVYGMLIREGIDVKDFKDQLLNDDFGFLVLPTEFRKHLVAGDGLVV